MKDACVYVFGFGFPEAEVLLGLVLHVLAVIIHNAYTIWDKTRHIFVATFISNS